MRWRRGRRGIMPHPRRVVILIHVTSYLRCKNRGEPFPFFSFSGISFFFIYYFPVRCLECVHAGYLWAAGIMEALSFIQNAYRRGSHQAPQTAQGTKSHCAMVLTLELCFLYGREDIEVSQMVFGFLE